MSTPLYDALKEYASRKPIRFHMPGHKGSFLPMAEMNELAPLDVTELPSTGNLYTAGEPFDSAQALWADLFGFEQCQFLTGGSTMGIHTGLALCCRPGDKVLTDRNCHRGVFNALALLDLEPVWLERPWLKEENLIGPISPKVVEELLKQNSDIKTVCITSPTYAGVLSNIGAISRIVHTYGGKLFVDGAHGAHLPFLGLAPFWGADAVVVSAHKTLPAMGQTALLFTNGFESDRVRQMASVYGSSSPSYPMLASLDVVREWMVNQGTQKYKQTAVQVAQLRRQFPSLNNTPQISLDPTRLTLNVKNGPAFARVLEEQGIFPEMEDGGHVILICTCQDNDAALHRLRKVLTQLWGQMGPCSKLPAPPAPDLVCSPRQALFGRTETLPLQGCTGRTAACQIAPYPPGVPVIAPGERIQKKHLAYLQEIGYNMEEETRVLLT